MDRRHLLCPIGTALSFGSGDISVHVHVYLGLLLYTKTAFALQKLTELTRRGAAQHGFVYKCKCN